MGKPQVRAVRTVATTVPNLPQDRHTAQDCVGGAATMNSRLLSIMSGNGDSSQTASLVAYATPVTQEDVCAARPSGAAT